MIDNENHGTDWDEYTARISERKESLEWAVLRKVRVNHFERFFDIQPGQRVLDAGCGHGEYTIFSLARGAQVAAMDTSEAMLNYTANACSRAGLVPETVSLGSISDIHYPDSSFDIVMCLSVLECVNDPAKAMHELARVLRPGGTLYLDVCNAHAVHWRLLFLIMQLIGMAPKGNMQYFTPKRLRDMVHSTGLQYRQGSGQSFSPPFSGLYTADLRRFTILPDWLIRMLDNLYEKSENYTNHRWPFRNVCWHYFLRAEKQSSN